MPRLPREYSESGIYHIMVRGNAKEDIFIDNQDKGKLLKILFQKRKEELFLMYSYCIMNNHAHFVLKELRESVSGSMKRITISYASYFNKKYKRIGHVFQDRFKSEAIKNDSQLLMVIRYVHNNPEKAAIMRKEDYPWSSFNFYLSQDKKLPEVNDILKYFSINIQEAMRLFIRFSDQEENKTFLDISEKEYTDQDDVCRFVAEFLKNHNLKNNDLNYKHNVELRAALIRELPAKFNNISQRSIAEVTGVSREKVRRILKSVSTEPSP